MQNCMVIFSHKNRYDYKSSKGSDESRYSRLTSATFHKKLKILVAGFDDGSFFLHEMPDFNLIHSLRLLIYVLLTLNVNQKIKFEHSHSIYEQIMQLFKFKINIHFILNK